MADTYVSWLNSHDQRVSTMTAMEHPLSMAVENKTLPAAPFCTKARTTPTLGGKELKQNASVVFQSFGFFRFKKPI